MKSLLNFKTTAPALVSAFSLVFLALPRIAPAVVPSPDGGYPGFNTAEGTNALKNLTTGVGNAAFGWYSLFSNTDGSFNTALGAGTLLFNLGNQNTAEGIQNTAVGTAALLSNTTGCCNTAIGEAALINNATGRGNIALGDHSGYNVTTANGVICIGTSNYGADVTNTTWISGIYGVTTQSGSTAAAVVSNEGQLGTVVSSERFKKDIASMEKASEAILALRPVTFHYKSDTKGMLQFGLIAEEVARLNPDLVLPDKEGRPYTIRYDAVNAMLLNEFLKEHRKVESLENAMAEQQTENAAMRAILKEQAAQIQKVSAQLELTKPAPQTVLNN